MGELEATEGRQRFDGGTVGEDDEDEEKEEDENENESEDKEDSSDDNETDSIQKNEGVKKESEELKQKVLIAQRAVRLKKVDRRIKSTCTKCIDLRLGFSELQRQLRREYFHLILSMVARSATSHDVDFLTRSTWQVSPPSPLSSLNAFSLAALASWTGRSGILSTARLSIDPFVLLLHRCSR